MSLKYTLDEAVGAWRRTSQIVSFTAGHVNFQNDVVNVSVNARCGTVTTIIILYRFLN